MELKDIKNINQTIYEMDSEISRNSKMMFIATLVFCSLNKDFRNPNKMTDVINFVASDNPVSDLVLLAKEELKKITILDKTYEAVVDSLKIIDGTNTKLYKADRVKLQKFVFDFVTKTLPELSEGYNLFFETLYMEVDKKAKNSDKGITLTPYFASQLMVDLAELDYKNDIVADLCGGTGLFSLLSYNDMLNKLEADKANLSNDDYLKYKSRILNSIIANDHDAKMTTLCLANFITKDINTGLIYNNDIFALNKSDFAYIDKKTNQHISLYATKGILNPPYEDEYKPVEIIRKTIELIKGNNGNQTEKVVVIIPAGKFAKNKNELYKILNLCSLETVIKMQDNLFIESGQSPATCIFVFNLSKAHNKLDDVHYYNFSDSGFVYLKDSGMVDKNNTHQSKKKELLEKIRGTYLGNRIVFNRNWSNFYDVSPETEIVAHIDPDKVKINKDEADISFENIQIKKMLLEKDELVNVTNNLFNDQERIFEKYILDILGDE